MKSVEMTAKRAAEASSSLAALSTDVKDRCLRDFAERIEAHAAQIRQANEEDLATAKTAGLGDAKLRRLALSDAAIQQMADGLRQVSSLDDPVGDITKDYTVPSGLKVQKVRCPIGVIMMIYEARPNVTVDAFALCFKAGNACLLKGGREAARSNQTLADLAKAALEAHGVTSDAMTLITTSSRDEIKQLLGLEQYIDLVIPRGGQELIQFVHEHSRIPTVQHFHGVCHIFVDATADLERAVDVCATAKTSAPATCNALECILVHEAVAKTFVPRLVDRLCADGVAVRGDATVCSLAHQADAATEADWGREYLDLIASIKVVPDLEAAIKHIETYGSHHTDAILSTDAASIQRFTEQVHSSCTLVNASTRFNDGFQLGLGAEIGISTSKIHAFGPMGLEELTTQRFVVHGDWQTR